MTVLKLQSPLTAEQGSIRATLSDGFKLQIELLEPWLCRVAILPDAGLEVPNTWMVAPEGDVPWTGRCRLAREGFSCPELSLQGDGVVGTESLKFEIAPDHMALTCRIDRWRLIDTLRNVALFNMHNQDHSMLCIWDWVTKPEHLIERVSDFGACRLTHWVITQKHLIRYISMCHG